MHDAKTIAITCLAAWNATDPVARRAAVEKAWADSGSYLDPMMEGRGHAGLDAMIAAAQAKFQGLLFSLRGEPEAHHDRIRFSWSLASKDAAPVAHGTDFAVIGEDDRLQAVTGFLDQGVE